jgi:hypothetical protein
VGIGDAASLASPAPSHQCGYQPWRRYAMLSSVI